MAEADIAPPAIACVVTTVSVPHPAPLQPEPASDQFSPVLGLEPGTGVSVAAMFAEPPDARFAGAAICRVKLLVMVRKADVCFAGSAMDCAVIVANAALGRVEGAV